MRPLYLDEHQVINLLIILEMMGLPKEALSSIQKEYLLRQGLDQVYVDDAVANIVEDYGFGKARLQSIMDTWTS